MTSVKVDTKIPEVLQNDDVRKRVVTYDCDLTEC